MDSSRTLKPMNNNPNSGSSSTPNSPFRKLSTSFSPLSKTSTAARDSHCGSTSSGVAAAGPINLASIPAVETKSSTLPRRMPEISNKTANESDGMSSGVLRRSSAAGNVVSEYTKASEVKTSTHTLKRLSTTGTTGAMPRVNKLQSGGGAAAADADDDVGDLKRAMNSGDMFGEYKRQSQSCITASTQMMMPKVAQSSRSEATDSGTLKRTSGSGDLLGVQEFLQSSESQSRPRSKSGTKKSSIPSVQQISESEGMGGLKRFENSGNILGDMRESPTSSNTNSKQGSMSPLISRAAGLDGTLKRSSGSENVGSQQRNSPSSSLDNNDAKIEKTRQFGQIEVAGERKLLEYEAPVPQKMRQLGQMGVNLHQYSIASSSSSTPSPVVMPERDEFYSKDGLGTASKTNSKGHFTWNFGTESPTGLASKFNNTTAPPPSRKNESSSLRTSLTKQPQSPIIHELKQTPAPPPLHTNRRTSNNLPESRNTSPETKLLKTFPPNDNDNDTSLKEDETSSTIQLRRSPSLPRPPTGTRNSTHIRRRSVKPEKQTHHQQRSSSVILRESSTQQAPEEPSSSLHLDSGFPSTVGLLLDSVVVGGVSEDSLTTLEPALLAKRKQVEETVVSRVLGLDGGDVTTLSKMHGAVLSHLTREQGVRHRWLYAIYCVLKLVRESMRNLKDQRCHQQHLLEDLKDEKRVQHNVFRTRQSKADTIYSCKVRALLQEKRTSNIIKAIQKILFMRSNFMYHLSSDQQIRLCSVLQFRAFSKSDIVVKEGRERKHVCFILSGECEISSERSKQTHNTLSNGDTFGNSTKGCWTATVRCKEDTELLIVSQNDYVEIMDLGNEEQIALHMKHLSEIPHFAKHQPYQHLLKPFASVSQLFSFHPQEPIIHEGVENFSVFWILSGTCRAVKLVPFLRRKEMATAAATPAAAAAAAAAKKKYMLAEYEPGTTVIQEGEKVVMQLLTIRELGPGDYFPDLTCHEYDENSNNSGGGLKGNVLSRSGLLARLNDTTPSRPDSRSYVSIIANTKVEILGMTRLDYTRLASTEMILESMSEGGKLRVPLDALQKSVLSSTNNL
ncbi:hypothetical protein BDR26DRAFT_851155, partial [Obelidium mucronatum]